MTFKEIEIIKQLEKEKVQRDGETKWYYHGIMPKEGTTEKEFLQQIRQILTEGLKCAHLRGSTTIGGYNGQYYISISEGSSSSSSAYKAFENNLILVLENVDAIPTIFPTSETKRLANTTSILRGSIFEDEYQVFLNIGPNKIAALAYNLYTLVEKGYDLEDELLFLQKIIDILDQLGSDIPIYDLSGNKKINKQMIRYRKMNNE